MDRPTSIIVLGVLNLVFAGLGLLGGCYTLLSPMLLKHTHPSMADLYTGTFLVVTIVIVLAGTVSKGLMAVSGAGLVKGKAWGRRIGVLWAWLSMALGMIVLAVNLAYLLPESMEAAKADMQRQTPAGMTSGMEDIMEMSMMVTAVIGILIAALPYQITFLILINRKPVKDYFANPPGDTGSQAQTATDAPANPW